jgi:hypothetical protein
MSRVGGPRRRAATVAAVLAAGLALAACNAATASRVTVSGHPSTSIEVPLSLTACTASNSCVALGTSTIGSGASATAEYRRPSGLWVALRTPPAVSSTLLTASCWRDGCLIGGISPRSDLIWRYHASPPELTAVSPPPLGFGVSAISCYGPGQCTLADDTGPFGGSRLVITTDGGATWSTPAPIFVSSFEFVSSLSCVDALNCLAVLAPSINNGPGPSAADLEVTRDGGITWQAETAPSGTIDLSSLSCFTHHCVAVDRTSHGVEWARSGALGKGWVLQHLSGVPTAVACTPSGHCVMVGTTTSGPWLVTTRAGAVARRTLRFVPSPFTAAACGDTLCAVSAPSTVATLVP